MIKIPYGTSNFKKFATYGFYYVDRTPFIERIEQLNQHHLFFVRPRRFGKSLFISTLEYYYDIYHQKDFNNLFDKYYIGKNPTPRANQYLTITFDFSAIDTSSYENTYEAFLKSVKSSARRFFF
ncbi:MAG: AAA family ATPase [Bacteroidota bacterium]